MPRRPSNGELARLRNLASWIFGAALLSYEAFDVRTADAWLVAAGLVLMGAPFAGELLEAWRRPRPPPRGWLYDQDADQAESS